MNNDIKALQDGARGRHWLGATGAGLRRVMALLLAWLVLLPMAQAQTASSTTLSSDNSSVYQVQAVKLTARVTGNGPSGTVTFKDGGTTLGTATLYSDGTAELNTSFTTSGTHPLTAVYSGDGNNTTSSSAVLNQTVVERAATTINVSAFPNPVVAGQSVQLRASVASGVPGNVPTGRVTFDFSGLAPVFGGLTDGVTTLSVAAPCAGSYRVQATYAGDVANAGSSGAVSQMLTVTPQTVTATLTSNVAAAYVNQAVRLSVTVNGLHPSGTVTFKDGATTLGTGTVASGVATLDTVFSTAGSHSLTASYAGDSCNPSASGSLTQTVNAQTVTSTSLSASVNPAGLNQSVTLTATVTGSSPTGSVTFKDGATTLGTATLSGSTATLTTAFASAGSHSLSASYGGDTPNQASSASALALTVNKASPGTTLASSQSQVNQGQAFTLTASVSSGTATGTVTFKDGATTLGTGTLSGGTATLNTSLSTVGSHSLSASYPGDANNTGSNSTAVAVTVKPGPVPAVSSIPVTNYEYDAEGNPTKTVQAPGTLNYATQANYDSLSRVKDSTDAKAGITRFGYDGQDRTTQVTDPRNLVTQYPRNGLGDAKQLVSPDTGTASMTYDAAGNLKTRTDSRGALATYTYDELNRLTVVSYTQSGKPTVSHGWTYDRTDVAFGIGRLGTVTFPAGSLGITYDAQGRVLSHKQQVNAATGANAATLTHIVGYGYTNGQLTSITYPSGRQLTVTYTGGVPTAISLAKDTSTAGTPLITGIQWQPFGGVKHWDWQLASGSQSNDRTYDTAGRLVRYRLGTNLRDLSYDAADRISSFKHYDATTGAAQAALDQTFSYDELGRLTSITANGSSWSIGYDANGNRTGVTLNGASSTYSISATSNRITSISNPTRSFGYDATGNTTADGNYTATYDTSGRLATLTKAGVTSTFSIDALGRRVRKFDSSGAASTVVFVYGQGGELLGEYDSTGKAIREYVWLGSTPVAVFTPDPASATNPPLTYFIHADHIDTPRIIVDKSNQLRWRWLAEPFGTTAPENNPAGLGVFTFNLRFPGQYFDQATGLNYNYFRTYDPGLGAYTTPDPLGLDGGQASLYAYVGGNPLSLTDSTGLLSESEAAIERAVQQSLRRTVIAPAANASRSSPWPWVRVGAGAFVAGFEIYAACHPDHDEECKKLIEEIFETMGVLEGRMTDLYMDRYNLKDLAPNRPSPALPKGTGSWNGHVQKIEEYQRTLQRLIKEAAEKGCEVPPFAWKLAYAPPPPRRP